MSRANADLKLTPDTRQKLLDRRREAQAATARYELTVRRAYEAGANLKEIGTVLGLSHEGVRKIIQRAGGRTNRGATSGRQRAVMAGLAVLAVHTMGCQNPPDDDDLPGQAPTSVTACDPDTETCEP